jgi:hypothetical protein
VVRDSRRQWLARPPVAGGVAGQDHDVLTVDDIGVVVGPQNTGLSAKQLIDERVILEAKRRLSHADDSVATVAEQLGFQDASNFSAYFRRHTRSTPAAFRTAMRDGDMRLTERG